MATFTNLLTARLAKCAGSYTEIAFGVDATLSNEDNGIIHYFAAAVAD